MFLNHVAIDLGTHVFDLTPKEQAPKESPSHYNQNKY